MTEKRPGFQPGQSGNPAGRPKGARSKAMQALDAILDGEAEAITRKVIELALDGDTQAIRMCMDRLAPPRKERPITFALPPIKTAADLSLATDAVLQAVADGEITPGEAADLSKLVATHIQAIQATDLNERLLRIEQQASR
jgi:hypothetical protein